MKFIISIFVLIFVVLSYSILSSPKKESKSIHPTPKNESQNEKTVSFEKDPILVNFGKLIASQPPLGTFKLEENEKQSLLEGFKQGLQQPLSPTEAQQLIPSIQTYIQSKMAAVQKKNLSKISFPMDLEIKYSNGKVTTINQLVKGKKGVLLDFWASWCGPCMQLMPSLLAKAKQFSSHDIVVAGMNTENEATAEKIKKNKNINIPWLVEPESRPFSQLLKIESIPRMVLISPEGDILYNGHPQNDALYHALEHLGIKIDHNH